MSETEFYNRLEKILEAKDQLTSNTKFADIPNYDSLSTLTIVMFFDKELKKKVTIENISSCDTMEKLYNLYITN